MYVICAINTLKHLINFVILQDIKYSQLIISSTIYSLLISNSKVPLF